ncbi:MAG: hypothetical protein H6716_22340 [Polyangiaceae bacterium]|nr:hypothetical protein [Polyangiaceae bacterium]
MPVYVHFTLPLIACVAGGFAFRPYMWLGTLVVVVIHELGHIVLLRRYRLPVLALNLHGAGGEAHTSDWITPWQRCVVAWGGVLAQLSVFFVLGGLARLKLLPHTVKEHDLYDALVGANLLIALVNLLPFPGLDGAEAWKLPRFMYLRGKGAYYEGQLRSVEEAKKRLEAEDDDAPPPRDQLH